MCDCCLETSRGNNKCISVGVRVCLVVCVSFNNSYYQMVNYHWSLNSAVVAVAVAATHYCCCVSSVAAVVACCCCCCCTFVAAAAACA